jgi:hypothetical protein
VPKFVSLGCRSLCHSGAEVCVILQQAIALEADLGDAIVDAGEAVTWFEAVPPDDEDKTELRPWTEEDDAEELAGDEA